MTTPPSPAYDAALQSPDPTAIESVLRAPEPPDTLPAPPMPPPSEPSGLIPGPELRGTLRAIEVALDALLAGQKAMARRLAQIEATVDGARSAAVHCEEATTRYLDRTTAAHQRIDTLPCQRPQLMPDDACRPALAVVRGE